MKTSCIAISFSAEVFAVLRSKSKLLLELTVNILGFALLIREEMERSRAWRS